MCLLIMLTLTPGAVMTKSTILSVILVLITSCTSNNTPPYLTPAGVDALETLAAIDDHNLVEALRELSEHSTKRASAIEKSCNINIAARRSVLLRSKSEARKSLIRLWKAIDKCGDRDLLEYEQRLTLILLTTAAER